jgi:LPXTG-motif cell wall-anchored protein
VLRAGHYWVPHWYKASNNIAFWDKFSMPATKPRFDRGVLDTWWYDQAKAAKLTSAAATSGAKGEAKASDEKPTGSSSKLWPILGGLLLVALGVYALARRHRSS